MRLCDTGKSSKNLGSQCSGIVFLLFNMSLDNIYTFGLNPKKLHAVFR